MTENLEVGLIIFGSLVVLATFMLVTVYVVSWVWHRAIPRQPWQYNQERDIVRRAFHDSFWEDEAEE